jgi:hypothetical protein
VQEILNDYMWVFAGGTPPYELLKKIGVQFGMRDMTMEGSQEATQETSAKVALAPASTQGSFH